MELEKLLRKFIHGIRWRNKNIIFDWKLHHFHQVVENSFTTTLGCIYAVIIKKYSLCVGEVCVCVSSCWLRSRMWKYWVYFVWCAYNVLQVINGSNSNSSAFILSSWMKVFIGWFACEWRKLSIRVVWVQFLINCVKAFFFLIVLFVLFVVVAVDVFLLSVV